jgi:SpoVK/Ycf46/Vps4 family AAA+-type ATPase
MADLETVCRRAALLTLRDFIDKHPQPDANPERLKISRQRIVAAISEVLATNSVVPGADKWSKVIWV